MLNKIFSNSSRFFEPMRDNKSIYLFAILIYFVWAVDRVIHILFLERLIHYLELSNSEKFTSLVVVYLCYMFTYTIFQIFSRKKGRTEVSDTAIKYIQNIYLKDFINLNNNYTEKFGTGKLTAIVNNGIDRWGRLLDMFINQFINVLLSFFFTCYMLLKSEDVFLLAFVIIYILFYISGYFLNKGAIKYRRKRRDNSNLHTKNLVKVMMNKQEILQSGKIDHELSILDSYKDKEIFYNKKMSNFLQPLFEGPNVVLSFIVILFFVYLGKQYLSGAISLSLIVGISSALILMKTAVEKGIMFFKDFTKEFTDIEKLWEFFDDGPRLKGYNSGDKFDYKKGDISFKDVNYSYIKGKAILDNFSLDIEGGKVTALVGDSGGGKSTIAKLIGGYIQKDFGSVIVDGQDLENVSLSSYYKNIGYLTQEPSVFDGSVLDNLTYAIDRDVTKKELDDIIEMAKCEFIYDLPNGIDTEIGERGVKLSGGQRQRLAIAKIMLKNPKIIILDEPTSALDSMSEDMITKAMNNLFKGRTVIVIAHRLQTVKNADMIYVIGDGKVIEQGDHKDLISKKGKYFKLLELQSGF